MTTNVQIAYQVTAQALVAPSALLDAVEAVILPTGPTGDIPQLTGAVLASDTSVIVGSIVTRTINFTVGAQFAAEFPVGSDQAAPFRNLYTAILANALSTTVTPVEPVLT